MQGYELYGFTRDGDATVYREWAPAAQSAQLIGDFNGWEGTPLQRDEFGVWSVRLPDGECEQGSGLEGCACRGSTILLLPGSNGLTLIHESMDENF